ncbi:DUF5658 family protein [Methylomonas methanica]|uniref:DUF5658 domain-containing protein n=1 Tax=Methylomonas methanica (strain DSM 25384 / MC09) TaxID=857087 RepID=G0A3R7_METMM|nr:DUF5658 family protein [Methylomonas methanica]AEG01539.1 hypothetical protein Metme_3164 [Methylomonas methanica MC09]
MQSFSFCKIVNATAVRLLEPNRYWLAQPKHVVNALLIVFFGLLHIADGLVTYLGLSFAAVDEVNPLLNYFAGLWGLGLAITLLKLAILFAIAYIFLGRDTIKSRWGTATLAWADTFYSWVVTNNFVLVMGT